MSSDTAMNAPETQALPDTESSQPSAAGARPAPPPPPPPPPEPEGFWKLHHAVIGLVVVLLVVLMVRGCGGDEPEAKAPAVEETQPQAIVVQIPARQVPVQQPLNPPPAQQPAYPPAPGTPEQGSSNPWSARQQPGSYGSAQSQQWGRSAQPQPRSYSSSTTHQYRPLDAPAAQAPVRSAPQPQPYYPAAPYDQRSGSSFGGVPAYPYGSGYPGYYGPGAYGMPPGSVYTPGWPGVMPGWPGVW